MSETDATQYLDLFPGWLRNLGQDANALGALLEEAAMPQEAREAIAGGITYLFKSLDLIPDGIDDIGYLDDAFVLRVAADLAVQADTSSVEADKLIELNRLACEVDAVRAFLGENYGRLESYVKGLKNVAARGRSVADVVGSDEVVRELLSDVRGFVTSYEPPSFGREEKNLIKLRAFFDAKLPK